MVRELFDWNYGMEPLPGRSTGQEAEEAGASYLRSLKQTNAPKPADADESSAPTAATERRRSVRYRCDGSAEFRTAGSDVRTWGTLSDVSMHGCYVEMTATAPVGTVMELMLDAAGLRVRATGEVKVSYPFLGMGIALRVTGEEQERLREMVRRLSERVAPKTEEGAEPPVRTMPATIPMFADAGELVKRLAHFFETHPSLSREEFLRMLDDHAESL